jgi:hypothetical protein
VVRTFEEKHATFPDSRRPLSILHSMARMNGWSPEEIGTLAVLAVDEYYKIFKELSGHDLHQILCACLQFDRIGNASAEMLEISRRAKEALQRIGNQSPINARRVGDVSTSGSSDNKA